MTESHPVERLVHACADGDPSAWEEFVRLTAGWVREVVRRCLLRTLGNASDADTDDLTADVYAMLVADNRRVLRTFRAPFNLRAWLAVLASRTCNRYFRKRHLRTAEMEDIPVEPAKNDAAVVQEWVARLPPEDRMLIHLFFIDQCSYAEISRILGIPEDSIGKRKFRVIKKLGELARRKGEGAAAP